METIPLDGEAGKNKDSANHPVDENSSSPKAELSNGDKKETINLDEFEKRQKLIEEQNRLKKEMLGKALALRY